MFNRNVQLWTTEKTLMEITMTTTIGEVSWSGDNDGEKKTNKKDMFLRLDDGSNELRFVTEPYQYLVHRYKKDKNDKIGQKIACSAINGSCPLCSNSDEEIKKVRRRWFVGVISRKTGTYKVLDISWAIFSQIKTLNGMKHWGHPSKYDIDITVDKNAASPNDYYKVNPIAKEPLSAADQHIKDKEVDLDELKRRCTPPAPETVQKILDRINGVNGSNANNGTPAKKVAAPSVVPVSLDDDEQDLAASFPNYESSAS